MVGFYDNEHIKKQMHVECRGFVLSLNSRYSELISEDDLIELLTNKFYQYWIDYYRPVVNHKVCHVARLAAMDIFTSINNNETDKDVYNVSDSFAYYLEYFVFVKLLTENQPMRNVTRCMM